MILLRIILIPFSLIYSVIIYFRNKFYDIGILKSVKVSKPVVSVGNITTGGTGKTPVTILTADYYLSKGLRTGIISRGYKRKSNELVLVSDGESINENIEESGDELVLIANRLIEKHKGKLFIAACSDRVYAAEFLIKKFNPDVLILDDGFQHRRLKRDLDIVLVDSNNLLKHKFLNSFSIPSGILRESFANLKRTGLIIQNNKNKPQPLLPGLIKSGKNIILLRYKTEYLIDNKNSILPKSKKDAVVFSGIANNESFIEMLKDLNICISEVIKFPDHINYTQSDIEVLKKKYIKENIIITTEKDFIKIRQFPDFVNNYPVYYLKLSIEANDYDSLNSKLNEAVK